MNNQAASISIALQKNSVQILKVCKVLSNNPTYVFIALQVSRSSTSAGANYEEACGAQSRADFIHKLHLTYKELRETRYWLGVMLSAELANPVEVSSIIDSTEELLKIIGKSLITSKKKLGNRG
jgi:four helix bundle protein